MNIDRRSTGITRTRWWLLLLALFMVLPCLAQSGEYGSLRNLHGVITDSSHEPIRNAVVQLRNSDTNQIITFITSKDGQYSFKRLNSHTDFQVWVEFRGMRSATRNISMFDSHMDKVINFTVRTY